MRKLVALLLAICMLCGISLSALAVSPNHTAGKGVDGLATFDPYDTTVPIRVKILDQSNRYAVDLVYPSMQVTFSAPLAWNVNTYQYSFPPGYTVNNTFRLQVQNHSDKPIVIAASTRQQPTLPITVTCTTDNDFWKLAGLLPGDGAKVKNITVTVSPTTTWEDVAKNMMENSYPYAAAVDLTIQPAE